MRTIFLLTVILLGFSACKKSPGNKDNTAGTNPAKADSLLNIHYGPDTKQTMDIYLPANLSTSNTKVLFMVHGGGWTEGDKADFTGWVAAIQASLPDFAIININYRLIANNQHLFPTQENDLKAAVECIYAKRDNYFLSEKWAFMGASAGGHLVLLQSYKYNTPVKAKAVVSFFGPTDLTTLYNSTNPAIPLLLAGVTGTTPALHPQAYIQSSPVSFVNSQSPPTMLLQGGTDPLVPPSQQLLLKEKLQAAGVPNQYVFYPTEGHGWVGVNLLDSFTKMVAFLKLYVN